MTEKAVDEEGYFDPLPRLEKSVAADQWTWIESEMQASTADYLLVVGHYPVSPIASFPRYQYLIALSSQVYSACSHGSTQTLIDHLLPLLKQYKGHYLSGHDHCMEHIVEVGVSVNHYLSGMGVDCCYFATNKRNIPTKSLKWIKSLENKDGATGGFSSFEVDKTGMTVKYYDQDGALLYTAPAVPPRKRI